MKKVIMKTLCAGLLVASVSSCATYTKDAPILGVGANSINTYVAADLDYASAKQVEATVNTRTLLGFIQLEHNGNKILKNSNRYKGLSKSERLALYRAKENSDCDIILEPEFERETHKWFFGAYRTTTTKVKGWGIKMKGVKEDNHGIPNADRNFGGRLF